MDPCYTEEPEPMSPAAVEYCTGFEKCHTCSVSLVPSLPGDMNRYTRGDQRVETYVHNIYPLLYSNPLQPVENDRRVGWDEYIHPEGNIYFHNTKLQVVTSCDIIDDDVNDCIRLAVDELERRMRTHMPAHDLQRQLAASSPDVQVLEDVWHRGMPEWELCLDVYPATQECRYYIADWSKRIMFWLEEDPETAAVPFTTKSLKLSSYGSYNQLRIVFECQFWKHVEYFPDHRALPEGYLEKLKEFFLYGATDRMTSTDSTISYTPEDIRHCLQMFTCDNWGTTAHKGAIVASVARHWHEICNDRAHNLHGERSARLSRSQSRYFEPYDRTPLSFTTRSISCVFLFNKPKAFFHQLCATWVDRTVFIEQWRELVKDVQEEWKSISFMATIMLAVNMGFLTIEQIGHSHTPYATTARTLGVISALLAIGSVMSGMLLAYQHRTFSHASFTAKHAHHYLSVCDRRPFGLYGAAVIFSAPFAMMIWSLVLFVVGILCYSVGDFSQVSSRCIALVTGTIAMITAHHIVYFLRMGPEPRGSTWTEQAVSASVPGAADIVLDDAEMQKHGGDSPGLSRQATLVDAIGSGPRHQSIWDSIKKAWALTGASHKEQPAQVGDLEAGVLVGCSDNTVATTEIFGLTSRSSRS